VQVFRYITDAEAAKLKAQRDAAERKPAAAAGSAQANPDVAVKKDSAAH
jgi:hypothetical protein